MLLTPQAVLAHNTTLAEPDPIQACAQSSTPAAKPTDTPTPKSTATVPFEINGQTTFVLQNLFKFNSPYEGHNSLLSRDESEISQTYTLYFGVRPRPNIEFYVDPEMARGHGIGQALGLAGYTNGEVIRNPELSQDPYIGRYFLRWNIATGSGKEEVPQSQNQVATTRPTHRVVITAGKMGVNDLFDLNTYANNTRTQFTNWALLNNGAWDYAADTRGYTLGVVAEWINPDWAVRVGSFQMPVVANGIALAGDIIHNRGDQVEFELHPRMPHKLPPAIARLLLYRNVAHMGNYEEALQLAQETATTPDITKVEHRGNVKYGFGLNGEVPLGDVDKDGTAQTGLFARYGWDDGRTESFAYTEIDRTVQLGGQLSGRRWHRPNDRFALALVQNDLSNDHKNYLAAGGLGFILGDGRLNYGPERILETYYLFQASSAYALTLDYQFIDHPGYNRDRGPVSVLSFRVHAEF
jgi:carbohydrate-selective porin OprB